MGRTPRAMEIVAALRRLGYVDKPSVGDHIRLFKLLADHPEGSVTISTSIDCGAMHKHDMGKIRGATHLKNDEMWARALAKKLPMDEYDAMLKSMPKSELVLKFWRPKLEREREAGEK